MPVLVGAAAGESLTASVPPPAVYGYIPEQHVAIGKKTEAENQENPPTDGAGKTETEKNN